MIDIATGELSLSDGTRIGPSFTLQAFFASPFSTDAEPQGGAAGWASFRLSPQMIAGDHLSVTLRFHAGPLAMVGLALVGPHFANPEDEWSEEAALAAKLRHDRWLAIHVGLPPYSYPWGVIDSSYDPRSVSSSIFIRYKT